MGTLVMGRACDARMDPAAIDGMFELRHTVFHDRLGWEVNSNEGRERDRYDDLDPIYMIVRRNPSGVEGCWRLLPTTGSYMLRDTFPELLDGEPAPCDSRVWELSRFALAPTSRDDRRQAHFGDTTFTMMQQVVAYAENHGIDAYVTVTSLALERMLRRIGVPLRRFGAGNPRRIGRVMSVACWITIDETCREAVWNGAPVEVESAA